MYSAPELAPPEEPPPPPGSVSACPLVATKRVWRAGSLTYTSAGLVALFGWLLWGDFAWSMRDRSVGPMAQWYLKHLEVPNLLFALLLSSFPALVAFVLGPVISYRSDRHRGPRGRRIPFLLVTTPIAAFGMIGLGLCPLLGPILDEALGAASPGARVCSLICFGVFWATFEFATIAATAVFGGLINDVVPKPLVGRFYGLFRMVSLLDGVIFNYWLMGKVETHYTMILLIIGAFYCVGFLWVCLKVKEGEYPPPPPVAPDAAGRGQGIWRRFGSGARTYCRECFANRYYVSIFVMLMVAAASFMPVNVFMIPYARSLGMSMETYGKCMALVFGVSLGLAYFLGWASDVFHPLRVSIAALLGYALVTVWGAMFARDAGSFAVALVLHGVLSGCYFTSSASLGLRLYPQAKFAQFASAAGILGSVANFSVGPLVGSLLDTAGWGYHATFGVAAGLAVAACAIGCMVHRGFTAHGGSAGYTAP